MTRTILTNCQQAKGVDHRGGVWFTCANCGETKPVQREGGTGYGCDTHDNLICYECCGKGDKAAMQATGKAILYFTPDAAASYNRCKVTNWPGTLSFTGAYSVGRHNIAGKRYDVEFRGPDGFMWHGVTYGDNTQICHCKRTKRRAK